MPNCRPQTDLGKCKDNAGRGNRHGSVRALAAVLLLTASFTVAEIVGGLLTGSLALLADAGHMLSDDLSLGLALFAAWVARRPPTPYKTFGYRRVEVLAALVQDQATFFRVGGFCFTGTIWTRCSS